MQGILLENAMMLCYNETQLNSFMIWKGDFNLRSFMRGAFIAVLVCSAICFAMSSCGKNGDNVSDSDMNIISSHAEQKELTELETLVQEDQFQEQVKALSQTYEAKGLRLEVVAEGNSVVYKCIYTVAVDGSKSKEELSEHLESKAFETSIDSVLRSFKAQVPQTDSVIVRYYDMNGNIIASKEYK